MKTIDLHQVDAFTSQLFGGNPAGVVTNADELTDAEMKQIAREMNLSETAFVFKSSSIDADVKLRFFTPPGDEIKFCGHATVGALFQLAQLDLFGLGKSGKSEVRVETNAGILPMAVTNKNDTPPRITFTAPKVEMSAYRLQGKAFADEVGVSPELIKADGTILIDTVLNYVYIPTKSLKMLGKQSFDFARICERFGEEKVVIFCFFTNETTDIQADLHARGLAPNVGVDEDPFTGSMQAGLVYAAKQNGYVDTHKQQIVTEQGYFIGRPGFAEIDHDTDSGELRVTASATQVFSTKLEIKK